MTASSRFARLARIASLVGWAALGATVVALHAQPRQESSATGRPAAPGLIRREGSLLEARGRFDVEGGRLRFTPEGDERPLRCLENLSAERVEVHLRETAGASSWRVEGTLTEYQGSNYLLIEYARRTP